MRNELGPKFGRINEDNPLLVPQSCFGYKLLEIWLVCPQNGTAVLNGIIRGNAAEYLPAKPAQIATANLSLCPLPKRQARSMLTGCVCPLPGSSLAPLCFLASTSRARACRREAKPKPSLSKAFQTTLTQGRCVCGFLLTF